MASAKSLGLNVLGSDPNSRGFSQPCPLWDGECTIYTLPQYPHFCALYKCKLLKNVTDEMIQLSGALTIVQEAKQMIDELEMLLPVSANQNFRGRLITELERGPDAAFQQKAHTLLLLYRDHFGVKDLVDQLDEMNVE